MPKITTPLTDKEIKNSKLAINKKTGKTVQNKLSDGQGLCLIVPMNGSKYFRFDYSFNGKRKSISFGTYPTTSLKEARDKRADAKELIKNGIDPSIDKQKVKNIDKTFKEVTNIWLEIQKKRWGAGTYKNAVENMNNNAIVHIGNKALKDVTRLDILDLLQKMADRDVYELQRRILNLLNRIYKYAVTYNIVDHNIIADIDTQNILNLPKRKHFSAITNEDEIKQLMIDIKDYRNTFKGDVSTYYALNLAPYVFTRPYNLRFAQWDEIDLEKGIWDIPGSKMKTGKDFIIPLSEQAINIIKEILPYSKHKSKFIFPSPTSNVKPLSENTLNMALKRMGYKDRMTSHGFRSMFSTIAHEKIKEHGFFSDIIELSLAHEEKNKVKAAYNRENKMKYFDERKELLQWWADWLDY